MSPKMTIVHMYLTENQSQSLRKLPGSMSSHIRIAIDDYMQKLNNTKVSSSLSERKDNG